MTDPIFNIDDERQALYAMLEGGIDPDLQHVHFWHIGRALIFAALAVMSDCGLLLHRCHLADAARLNANMVYRLLLRSGAWNLADSPRHELREILSGWTSWAHASHYGARVRDAAARREMLDAADEAVRLTHSMLPLSDAIEQLESRLRELKLCA